MKILLVSDLQGNLDFLSLKIAQFSKKGTIFDFVLCTGNTLSLSANISDYITGLKIFPIPAYFIESGEIASSLHSLHQNGGDIFHNFTFLGVSGVKNIKGFKIGYLSGRMNK